jgi:hypothetical protein
MKELSPVHTENIDLIKTCKNKPSGVILSKPASQLIRRIFMPGVIDPETMNADDLPGVWSPVQWELTEEERLQELETQSKASLLWAVNAPEAILRLLLQETDIERLFEPPEGYDPADQGDWNPEINTYGFQRLIELVKVVREHDYLYLEYKIEDLGYWSFEIEPEKVTIERI